MFSDHRQDYPSDTALAEAVAKKLGSGGRRREGGDATLIDALLAVQGTPEGLYGRRK